jgi:hypothetical protein
MTMIPNTLECGLTSASSGKFRSLFSSDMEQAFNPICLILAHYKQMRFLTTGSSIRWFNVAWKVFLPEHLFRKLVRSLRIARKRAQGYLYILSCENVSRG